MGVLVALLFAISLFIQPAQGLEVLNKDGILCLSENQEKTALARWLHCLQKSSLSNAQDVEAEPLDIIEDSADERLIQPQEFSQLTDIKGIVDTDNSFIAESEKDKGDLHLTEKTDVDDDPLKRENLIEPPEFCQLPDFKRIIYFENQFLADDEENIGNLQLTDRNNLYQDHIEKKRSGYEDVLLRWLKLNVTIFALSKLLLGLFKSKMADRVSSEQRTQNYSEDSSESVPEINKSVIVDDRQSTSNSGTANLQMLGSSLGSAVGAVFSEVLMKSHSSGSSLPADKVYMILEIALKDLLSQVEGDDCCTKVLADFLTSFKSTYTTMYRIRQACASYEWPGATDTESNRDNGSSTLMPISELSTCEKELGSAKAGVGVRNFEDDAWQVKDQSCQDAHTTNEQQFTANTMPELPKPQRPSTLGEQKSAYPASSSFNYQGLESDMEMDLQNRPWDDGIDDAFEDPLVCASTELRDKTATHVDYIVEDSSSVCEEVPAMTQSNAVGMPNNPVWMGHNSGSNPLDFQKIFLEFYQRHVYAQEQHNQFQYTKLRHLIKQQDLEEEKIQLSAAANGLMRENIDLGRSKANFKENKALEQQTKAAHSDFCTTCADELAAGLCVMLTALVYSVRMYSYALLNDLVSMCQPSGKEPRRSIGFHIDWFYSFLDSLAGKLQTIVCHFAVTGRILIGSILVAIVAQSLLRRSVANSSQAMPATILVIVLGGVCGFIGKVSVDSLGGSGNRWWLVWGIFCLLHALANCFTPSIYRLLHGSAMRPKSKFSPPYWTRRLAFHSSLVLFLPLLAGLLPFGTFSCVMSDLSVSIMETLASFCASSSLWVAQLV